MRFPAGKVKVRRGLKVVRARTTSRTPVTCTLAAGKWQKWHFGRFTVADKNSEGVALLRFPAGKVKVFHVGNFCHARKSLRTSKTFTFPAGKVKASMIGKLFRAREG